MKKIKIQILLVLHSFAFVLCGKANEHASTLMIIHDHLKAAIYNCALDDRLLLQHVFAACDMLRNGTIELPCSDKVIVDNIIQLINTRLMRNPTLISFLKNLDASVESRQRLSENEFATIIKNSALLVPIDEIFSFAEILKTVNGKDNATFNIKRLNGLLKSVQLDTSKTPLKLWEKRDDLRRLYALLEYQAETLTEKIQCTKKSARAQKNINTVLAALGITDEYAAALKKLEPFSGYSQKKLYELFEDAFCGESNSLSLAAYARYVEKCVRQNQKISL